MCWVHTHLSPFPLPNAAARYSPSYQGYEEYSRIEMLQMAGRAGRPQFDDLGVCVVMTREEVRSTYERMLSGTETIESHLHEHTLTHLNAEIAAAGTYMSDITVCLRWLQSTFLYTRMRIAPSSYGLKIVVTDDCTSAVDAKLKKLLVKNLNKLSDGGMLRFAEDGMGVQPLLLGTVMARFSLEFETVCTRHVILYHVSASGISSRVRAG